jgi:GNAT superfamily N-acetyltransferase
VRVAPLDETTAAAWAALFDRCGCPCFCRWWHFTGTKNDWLARIADHRQRNRDEQLALVAAGDPGASGLVALEGEVAVGWMKLTPSRAVPKLLRQGPYRAMNLAPADDVWSIGCLLVDPASRRRGVARALVRAASDFVRAHGGRVVQAYPRRADHRLHDEEAWTGTAALLASCGFVEVGGEGPYPVMEKRTGA